MVRLVDLLDHPLQLLALGITFFNFAERMLVLSLGLAAVTDIIVGTHLTVPSHPDNRLTLTLVTYVVTMHIGFLVQLTHHLFFALTAGH